MSAESSGIMVTRKEAMKAGGGDKRGRVSRTVQTAEKMGGKKEKKKSTCALVNSTNLSV